MKQLSENILDITENSVKAKASLIKVTLTENTAAHTLDIDIADNGCGMSGEILRRVSDPFYTTRTTRKVGLGIPFFREAAEMTGGSFRLNSEVGVGTDIGATFHTDSIDCPPLGDMPSTVMTLVGGAPDTDFVFTHTVNDRRDNVLDTRELRQTLGDVPLDTPEVLLWIKECVGEWYTSDDSTVSE